MQSPPGHTIGTVTEAWNLLRPKFKVLNSDDDTIFDIYGSVCCNMTCCGCCCCKNTDFTVYDHESGDKQGVITKKWSGLFKEALTTTDTFGVNFPDHANPAQKALLLSACILIVNQFDCQINN